MPAIGGYFSLIEEKNSRGFLQKVNPMGNQQGRSFAIVRSIQDGFMNQGFALWFDGGRGFIEKENAGRDEARRDSVVVVALPRA